MFTSPEWPESADMNASHFHPGPAPRHNVQQQATVSGTNNTSDDARNFMYVNGQANHDWSHIRGPPTFRPFPSWPQSPSAFAFPAASGHQMNPFTNYGSAGTAYLPPFSTHHIQAAHAPGHGFSANNPTVSPPRASISQSFQMPIDLPRPRLPVLPYATQPPASAYAHRQSYQQRMSSQNDSRQPPSTPRRPRSRRNSSGMPTMTTRPRSGPDLQEALEFLAADPELLESTKQELKRELSGPKTKIILSRATEESLEAIPEHKRDCPLCTLEFENNNYLAVMSCCDTFTHTACLSAWINSDNYMLKQSCLKCRRQISARRKLNEIVLPVTTNKWDQDINLDAPEDLLNEIEVDVTHKDRSYRRNQVAIHNRMIRLAEERRERRERASLTASSQGEAKDTPEVSQQRYRIPFSNDVEWARNYIGEPHQRLLDTPAEYERRDNGASMSRDASDNSAREDLDPTMKARLLHEAQLIRERTAVLRREGRERGWLETQSDNGMQATTNFATGTEPNVHVGRPSEESQQQLELRQLQARYAEHLRSRSAAMGYGAEVDWAELARLRRDLEIRSTRNTESSGYEMEMNWDADPLSTRRPAQTSSGMWVPSAQFASPIPPEYAAQPPMQPPANFRPPPPNTAFDEMFQNF